MNAYAIIMAGGNGERFWPMSTPERPKQFVTLFGGRALIRHAADCLKGLIPPERTLVITAERLVAQTRRALPGIPQANVIGEPCRRDTAAAVACACGLVKRLGGPDAVGCILTADQLMEPAAKFRRTLKSAITVASRTDAIVTVGIEPDHPATGFGYIECGPRIQTGTPTEFHAVRRFVGEHVSWEDGPSRHGRFHRRFRRRPPDGGAGDEGRGGRADSRRDSGLREGPGAGHQETRSICGILMR